MNAKEMLLASKMLNDAGEVRANAICNDWSFPADWTTEEREQFVREYHEWNGDPEEFDPKFLVLSDFAVLGFLAYKCQMAAANAGSV